MPRGRVEDEAPPRRVSNGNSRGDGNGPPCPDGHGHLYEWTSHFIPAIRWFCPHSDHGGNGRFFTDREVG